ncbi:hypothetical protein Tcan_16248 [Toxocara canis]|uniref:Uncharacterized protein n=1 Tax=Toxocara canis TaxID=6265 RepID=A0A0B2UVG1_TOXCA|nr:hypothetical protein Tcan_16248 [Toxocara canis]
MLKNLFRSKRSYNKENEGEAHAELGGSFDDRRGSRTSPCVRNEKHSTYKSYREEEMSNAALPYHVFSSQRNAYRGAHSCYGALGESQPSHTSHFSRSFAFGSHAKARSARKSEHVSSSRRHHPTSEYGSCDPSPNTPRMYSRELDDSDIDTWNSERIIRELRAEVRMTTDRKNYYKDLYKTERQDRLRDRELRDLVEKKLMDDLRNKELECANHILHIKALEQELHRQASFPQPMRESNFRVPHYCTPSTSNTASTMAGAGEALSSTSELFAVRGAFMVAPCCEMPDETKVFRQPEELSLELPRNGVADVSNAASVATNRVHNTTVLEEDRQSDNGYGTTSECASEIRSIRRVHSDSQICAPRTVRT